MDWWRSGWDLANATVKVMGSMKGWEMDWDSERARETVRVRGLKRDWDSGWERETVRVTEMGWERAMDSETARRKGWERDRCRASRSCRWLRETGR